MLRIVSKSQKEHDSNAKNANQLMYPKKVPSPHSLFNMPFLLTVVDLSVSVVSLRECDTCVCPPCHSSSLSQFIAGSREGVEEAASQTASGCANSAGGWKGKGNLSM